MQNHDHDHDHEDTYAGHPELDPDFETMQLLALHTSMLDRMTDASSRHGQHAPDLTLNAADLMMLLSSVIMWLNQIEAEASNPHSPRHDAFARSVDAAIAAYERIADAYGWDRVTS